MIKLLNLSSFIVSVFLISFQLLSQAPENVSINGKTYFVYPHKLKLNPYSDYKYALKKKYFTQLFFDFDTINSDWNKYELKNIRKDIRKDKRRYSQFLSFYHYGYKYKRAIRSNYRPFFEPSYSLDEDIVPSLDSLPDGMYVQYFNDFIAGDSEGNIIIERNKVAGIFSIKNNVLNGKAAWFNLQGDTLKQGIYLNGVKEGEWKLKNHLFFDNKIYSYQRKCIINNDFQPDTLEWNALYSNGLKNGAYRHTNKKRFSIISNEGFYTNNKESGTWIIKASREKNSYICPDRNDLIALQKYTYNSSDSISHQYLIRNKIVQGFPYDIEDFDFASNKYNFRFDLLNYYQINFPIDKNQRNYYRESSNGRYNYYQNILQVLSNEYRYNYGNSTSTYQQLTDQFGKKNLFDGAYESYYPNGQLMFHFNFKDNQLVKEDTLFWDNGKPMDVILPVVDSNQFTRSIFDYTGKMFVQNLYDSKGNFIRTIYDAGAYKQILIEDLVVEYNYPFYYYHAKLDSSTIFKSDTLLISKCWHKLDTIVYKTTTYVPDTRKLIETTYSISGKITNQSETIFDSKFSHAHLESRSYFGDFCLQEKSELEIMHTNIINLISSKNNLDEFASPIYFERKLLKNNIPYSGTIDLKNNLFAQTHSRVGESTIKIPQCGLNKLKRLYKKQKKNHKQKERFDVLDYTHFIRHDINEQIEEVFFSFYWLSSPESFGPSSYNLHSQYIDGQASGKWMFNHIRQNKSIELNFQKNELNGPAIILSNRNEYNDKLISIKPKTIFIENYINNTLQGPALYNLEKTKTETTYLDNEIHGIEINNLEDTYFSLKTYNQGTLNGQSSVFKINSPYDTTYFLKSNFKDGNLYGNAIKYSANGKIEFLFENNTFKQYDTMQMVLEEITLNDGIIGSEKIFDQGLLDVEYQFNSRDSLEFYPSSFYDDFNLIQLKYQLINLKKKRHSKSGGRVYHYGYYDDYYEEDYEDDFEMESEYYDRKYEETKSLIPKNFLNYRILKYYGNGQVAREGELFGSDKVGNWKHYSYDGKLLYEINYADTSIQINDSLSFQSRGTFTLYDTLGTKISQSYIIKSFEKYDCSNNDHYTIRQFYTFWEKEGTNRINGYVKNYYDNGVLQSEGMMKNGLPEGVWKYYDPFGKLNQLGKYTLGLKEGRWIKGDLGKIKYLGDICFDPNTPNLDKLIKERETELDIKISIFIHGKSMNNSFYEINKFGANSSGSLNDSDSDIQLR